jgi:hypothetical protein
MTLFALDVVLTLMSLIFVEISLQSRPSGFTGTLVPPA